MADSFTDGKRHPDWGYIAFVVIAILTVGAFFVWNNAESLFGRARARVAPDTTRSGGENPQRSMPQDTVRRGAASSYDSVKHVAQPEPAHPAGTVAEKKVPAVVKHSSTPEKTTPAVASKKVEKSRDGPVIRVGPISAPLAGGHGTVVATVQVVCAPGVSAAQIAFVKDIAGQIVRKALTGVAPAQINRGKLEEQCLQEAARVIPAGSIQSMKFADFGLAEQE